MRRRASRVSDVELSMAVKIKTMLEQSMASLTLQQQPQAILKTRLSKDFIPEQKQAQDYVVPREPELSFYKTVVGVCNYESNWQWEFLFSDGSRTGNLGNKNFTEYRVQPRDAVIRTVRLLYCKTRSYPSVLVAMEFLDPQGKSVLSTKLMSTLQEKTSDYGMQEVALEEYEKIVGVRSSQRGYQYHYDFQLLIGRLE